MTKRLHILTALILLTGMLGACRKDLLDLSPQDKITDADFWKSPNDLQLYVNGFYNRVLPAYTGFVSTGPYADDANSDNMIATTYNSANNGERVVPASGGGWEWGELRNINYFLANYHRVVAPAAAVSPFVGEAYFFRAWFYFDKLKSFGDLPWVGKPLLPGDLDLIYGARKPRNVIADSILADLDKAIGLLPSKTTANGRISREVAMAFLTRVALFEGTWEKYHAGTEFGVAGSNGSQYLTKAATTAATLIQLNLYDLDNTGTAFGSWKLFNQTDSAASREVMFWRKYSVTDNPTFAHNWQNYSATGAGIGVTKNLVDDYLMNDGRPKTGNALYKGDDSLVHVTANRDPRLLQTICVPDGQHVLTVLPTGTSVQFTVPTFSGNLEKKSATGYQLYKGLSTDYLQQQNLANVSYTGLILIRYAEVLLNFAEAKAELGTLTQGDVDMSINKLRRRVGMPDLAIAGIVADPEWIFPGLSPVINEVRRERRVELAAEGYRKTDLFRWAAADECIVGWKPKGARIDQWKTLVPANVLAAYPTDDQGYIELFKQVGALANGYQFRKNRDYLMPIPTNEITLNPKLGQNPNWK